MKSLSAISEDNRFIAVHKNAIFDVRSDRAGENNFLEIAAFTDQVLDSVAMRHADDILFNDGPVIENFGDIVARGADQLHATLKCLVVRTGAHECREERMMDVNDPLRIAVNELIGENLHVPGQDHKVRLISVD